MAIWTAYTYEELGTGYCTKIGAATDLTCPAQHLPTLALALTPTPQPLPHGHQRTPYPPPRYIVDGEWRLAPGQPTAGDGSGNVNNIIDIGKSPPHYSSNITLHAPSILASNPDPHPEGDIYMSSTTASSDVARERHTQG